MITKTILKDLFKYHNLDIEIEYTESPVAPGHLKHHYMPNLPIITVWGNSLSKISKNQSEIPKELLLKANKWILPKDANLAARCLYQKFRELDTDDASAIILVLDNDFREKEEWFGILNRIKKATTYLLTK
jgi:hypothetical protein